MVNYSKITLFSALMLMISGPQTMAANSFSLQLGSSSSEQEARQQAEALKTANADILGKLTVSVSPISIDNKITYRMQAGPLADRDEAQTLCSRLNANNAKCYVVESAMAPQTTPVTSEKTEKNTKLAAYEPEPAVSQAATTAQTAAPSLFAQALAKVEPAAAPAAQPAAEETEASMNKPLPEPAPEEDKPVAPQAKPAEPLPAALPPVSGAPQEAAAPPPPPPPAPLAPPPAPPPPAGAEPFSLKQPEMKSPASRRSGAYPSTLHLTQKRERAPRVMGTPPAPLRLPPAQATMAPAKLALIPPPAPVIGDAGADQTIPEGIQPRVNVSEAIRVPLSTQTRGYRILPSEASSRRTLWAQLGSFTDETAALGYWEQFRAAHPSETASIRVRVIKPFALSFRNSPTVWLRVGSYEYLENIRALCNLAAQDNIRCGVVADLGAAPAANAQRRRLLPARGYHQNSYQSSGGFAAQGTYWAQLGTYPSPEAANAAWAEWQSAHPELLGRYRSSVATPPMGSNAEPVYRLRTGPFVSSAAANNLCGRMTGAGVPCIVVSGR